MDQLVGAGPDVPPTQAGRGMNPLGPPAVRSIVIVVVVVERPAGKPADMVKIVVGKVSAVEFAVRRTAGKAAATPMAHAVAADAPADVAAAHSPAAQAAATNAAAVTAAASHAAATAAAKS